MHLVFYSEAADVDHEIGVRVAENRYQISPGVVAIDPYREDQARIAMTDRTLRALYELLGKRYGQDDTEEVQPQGAGA
jgi:hypothetical protein